MSQELQNASVAGNPRDFPCVACIEAAIIAYERHQLSDTLPSKCDFAPVIDCTVYVGDVRIVTSCNECIKKHRYCNMNALEIEGDCTDFNVLSKLTWDLLRKKVPALDSNENPVQIDMMSIQSRRRIGAAYYGYVKVYLEALREHLGKNGLLGHTMDPPVDITKVYSNAHLIEMLWPGPRVGERPQRVRADSDHSYGERIKAWSIAACPRLNDEKLAGAKRQLYQAIVSALRAEGLSALNIADLLAELDNLSSGEARHIPDFMPRLE